MDQNLINFPVFHAKTAREENLLGIRLSEARRCLGLNQNQLADLLARHGISVKVAAVSKWEKGETVPNAYQLLALCQALQIPDILPFFTGTNTDTALNETGLKKLQDYREDLIASGRYRRVPEKKAPVLPCVSYIEMPVSLFSVSAGTGQFLDEENFEKKSFPAHTVPKHADFAIRVSGDSMEPVYQEGQYVWIQKCSRLTPGETGIFVHDGESFIKLYQEQIPADEIKEEYTDSLGIVHAQPVLLSYNKAYAPRIIAPSSSFQIIGRVLK